MQLQFPRYIRTMCFSGFHTQCVHDYSTEDRHSVAHCSDSIFGTAFKRALRSAGIYSGLILRRFKTTERKSSSTMRQRSHRFVIVLVAASFAAFTGAKAQEKKVTKADLPTAVQKTIDAQSQGATVRGFSTEVENGKRVYEAQ